MIRKKKETDLNKILQIWLNENITAHYFIDKSYWQDNFDFVKDAIAKADVYVYEENGKIVAFAGMKDNYLAGIFVSSDYQGRGVGKSLLNYLKENYTKITLSVFQENQRAVRFYLSQDFFVINRSVDEATGHEEWLMKWEKTR